MHIIYRYVYKLFINLLAMKLLFSWKQNTYAIAWNAISEQRHNVLRVRCAFLSWTKQSKRYDTHFLVIFFSFVLLFCFCMMYTNGISSSSKELTKISFDQWILVPISDVIMCNHCQSSCCLELVFSNKRFHKMPYLI